MPRGHCCPLAPGDSYGWQSKAPVPGASKILEGTKRSGEMEVKGTESSRHAARAAPAHPGRK